MNKRLLWVLLFCACYPLTGNIASAEDKAPCDPWAAKIAAVQGIVEAKRSNAEDWHSVKRSGIYCPGDQIRVGKNSRASIVLINETLVRLDQFSVITLNKIETEGQSLLELLKGIAHFISRVPRSLKVDTPFVNAAIEGTEFVVAVDESETTVTVFEGTVLTENENGQVRLTQNESSVTRQGQAPEKILLARPRDTVQWALYFPPLIKADAEGNALQQASALLFNGRAKEASELLAGLDSGEAKALQAIIAIVNNDRDTAYKLASDAIQQAPDSAATHIAMSYAQQARLDLDAALTSAKKAVDKENNNAIAWARLAELQLSVDELNDAVDSARKATELDNGLARAQTILGYAYLTRIDIDEALSTFNKAIELDQSDPLPHLGLGLAMIRKNELAEGRREIEVAASLDPNNAIIRSYLGKAYYEEKRGPLDAEQFAMAKELDPNDPTPYYYDAIRKQTENDPVGALEDLNKSIELNDNRAVYRSSLQLDQDEAARNTSLAEIYNITGMAIPAKNRAAKSLQNDPSNYSAHKFLSETYATLNRHEISRASELLQGKLLQPLNGSPILAHPSETNLNISPLIGSTSNNEYYTLFSSEGVRADITGAIGTNSTKTHEITISGLYRNAALSVSSFSYNTDGFRDNADIDHDIQNAFIQFNLNSKLSVQLEHQNRKTEQGTLGQSLDPSTLNVERRELDKETSRFGARYDVNSSSTLVFSYINTERNPSLQQVLNPITLLNSNTQEKVDDYQILYLLSLNDINLQAGGNSSKINTDTDTVITVGGFPIPSPSINAKEEQNSAFLYSNILLGKNLIMMLGLSYDDISSEIFDIKLDELSPKFGLTWNIDSSNSLRLAGFNTIKRSLIANQGLEPTTIAGFNQFYDDGNYAESTVYGIGYDYSSEDNLYGGFEYKQRDVTTPRLSGLPAIATYDNQDEHSFRGYLSFPFNNNWMLNTELIYEKIENDTLNLSTLETGMIPLTLRYFNPNGFYTILRHTLVEQEGRFTDPSVYYVKESFNTTDLELGLRLPKRSGKISLQVKNIFDNDFLYEDGNVYNSDKFGVEPLFIPEQTILATIYLLI